MLLAFNPIRNLASSAELESWDFQILVNAHIILRQPDPRVRQNAVIGSSTVLTYRGASVATGVEDLSNGGRDILLAPRDDVGPNVPPQPQRILTADHGSHGVPGVEGPEPTQRPAADHLIH